MFARWPDVDMRAANVAVLEQRKPVEYRGGGNAVESGKHPAITQDTDIVEGRLNSREHIANCGFGLVHQCHPSNVFHRGRGAGEGTAPAQGVWVTLSLGGKGHRVCSRAVLESRSPHHSSFHPKDERETT